MVNLLPKPIKRKIRFDYYLRLTAGAFFVCAIVILMGIALLIPSYLFARNEAETSTRYVASIQEKTELQQRGGVQASIALLAERLKIIKEYNRQPVTAHILSRLEGRLPSRVTLQKIGVRFTAPGEGDILISGFAETRNGLLEYAQALQKESIFAGVVVPVSQLSLDRDIDFSLSFAFTVTP
ncbi:hypothetical protein A2841_01010 [Candidatus Kaiserbacteria bacterium RIFCSPHIGHO2_01_FULL_48_10]|uniref:Uncharacterized protein n=1 Tax=Candidatus Kaiserbacteria bacterium RIFCSPHIGHO2_01_FULL_48_10 TaxID=1798476 RepID=A0A1F6C5B6_9BACT|nr:MAG: hypothetical protein A2841_01010 [Candidatus Kaiserbacteria bacterium RIFCSPHIGHO2_01_FULL_48_10]